MVLYTHFTNMATLIVKLKNTIDFNCTISMINFFSYCASTVHISYLAHKICSTRNAHKTHIRRHKILCISSSTSSSTYFYIMRCNSHTHTHTHRRVNDLSVLKSCTLPAVPPGIIKDIFFCLTGNVRVRSN